MRVRGQTKKDTWSSRLGFEALDQHTNTRKNVPYLKTIIEAVPGEPGKMDYIQP
jgi:hypothetical protein